VVETTEQEEGVFATAFVVCTGHRTILGQWKCPLGGFFYSNTFNRV